MKHIKVFSFLAVLAIFTFACKKTPHDMITGNWDVIKTENSTMTEQEDIDFFNQMNAEVIESEAFNFSEGKVTKKFPENSEGTWELDEKGTTLIIDWGENDTYSPHTFNVLTLSNDSLVIEEDYEEFFIKTTFVKIK
jgi:hypothetical protein